MKYIIQFLLTGSVFLLAGINSNAHAKPNHPTTDTTITFNVAGVCEMCKRRIEDAAQGRGVKAASWDVNTKILTLRVDPKRVLLQKVHERIATAGHDTPEKKAPDATYNQLPDCCRHREFSNMEEMSQQQESTSTTVVADTAASQKAAKISPSNVPNSVKGLVLGKDENGENKPLIGASVAWLSAAGSTATDENGAFTLATNGQLGRLIISYVGFSSDTISISDSEEIKVVLSTGKQLEEVRVTAPKRGATYINSYDPFRTANITQKELLKAACCNLSESFETNPSVDVSFSDAVTGSKQIQLLGLSGNYTQLTVENLPGPRGLATPLGLNSIPGTWIEAIQLVKGTGSVANGFESIAGQINVELKKPQTSERLYANIYANDFGKVDLNLNLAQQVGKKWSTTLLLHDAFLNNNTIDFNKDGFRDQPTGNLFSAVNRWSFSNNKGFTTHFGVKLLDDSKTGGQVSFDPKNDKFTTQNYGLEIQTKRWEAFAKLGYVFPGQAHKSIGLQLSTFDHQQDSYFGFTTYHGKQQNVYSNLIYQSQIGSNQHKFRTGLSFVLDQYDEQFNAVNYDRNEHLSGGFFEYTYSPVKHFDVVAGIREDYNNLYGWFATPRLNIRYEPFKGTVLRASVGRGQRTANIFAENNSVFVSARQVSILGAASGKAYGLNPEIAWNKGITIDQRLRLFNHNATVSAEFFRNDFQDQVIVDMEDPGQVRFYNLVGKSYANSFQTEAAFEPIRNFNVRLAYRYFDVMSTFSGQLLAKPFTAKHRGFANLAYEISGWKFDYTVSFTGTKRLPTTDGVVEAYKRPDYSPAYTTMNAQINKTLGKAKNIDLYIGGENLSNFFQRDVITAADQPFSSHFDASMIWGPVNGRMLYGGIRYSLKQ